MSVLESSPVMAATPGRNGNPVSLEYETYFLTTPVFQQRFIKLDMVSWHAKGVGMEYFDIVRHEKIRSGRKILMLLWVI